MFKCCCSLWPVAALTTGMCSSSHAGSTGTHFQVSLDCYKGMFVTLQTYSVKVLFDFYSGYYRYNLLYACHLRRWRLPSARVFPLMSVDKRLGIIRRLNLLTTERFYSGFCNPIGRGDYI